MRHIEKILNDFRRFDDTSDKLLAPGGSVYRLIVLTTFLAIPALSFADCNMTGNCPGSPNATAADIGAHQSTLDATSMFQALANAISGSSGIKSGEAHVVQNKSYSESLNGKNPKGYKVKAGDVDPYSDDSDISK